MALSSPQNWTEQAGPITYHYPTYNGPEPGDAIYAAFIPPEWVEHHIRAMDTPLQWLAQEAQKAEVS